MSNEKGNVEGVKLIAGTSNPELAREIGERIGVKLVDAVVGHFPDGETFAQVNENIRGRDVFVIQSTCSPANHNIMELLIIVDAVKRASAARITAVVPFYGYARQDRKDKPRVPITSKLVANLLVEAGVDRVLTMDLHTPQITGFFDIPVDHLSAGSVFYPYIQKYRGEDLIVVSPDVGGVKMASFYADMMGSPLGIVVKRRTDAEHVEPLHLIGEVEGKDVLVVDDIVQTGGTLLAAARLLKEKGGAKRVWGAVTHGLFNWGFLEQMKTEGWIDELITTNSTPVVKGGANVKVLSVAGLFAEAIMRVHNNESVTDLNSLLLGGVR